MLKEHQGTQNRQDADLKVLCLQIPVGELHFGKRGQPMTTPLEHVVLLLFVDNDQARLKGLFEACVACRNGRLAPNGRGRAGHVGVVSCRGAVAFFGLHLLAN